MNENQKLIELGIDLALGKVTQFSKEQAQEVLRKELLELTGSKDGKFDYKAFRKNKHEVFSIIEEIVDVTVREGLRNQFEAFVDYRDVAFGDQLQFRPKTNHWYEVASIAGGTNNLRRQRIQENVPYTIETGWYGVKIYEGLERFLAGRVDWMGMIEDINRSFANYIKELIFTTIKSAYNGLTAPYKETGTFDLEKFNKIVAHVKAATGTQPFVVGTRIALQKVAPQYVTYGGSYMEDRNRDGFFKVVDGITLVEMEQGHKIGTDEFIIDDDFLLILPGGDTKIVKFVTEGETLIKEVNGQDNADDSQEYTVRKKFGVGVETTAKYGVYILG